MRMVAGAILILVGEQAFSHSFLIGFPHQNFARSILLPFSGLSILVGLCLLALGALGDQKPS